MCCPAAQAEKICLKLGHPDLSTEAICFFCQRKALDVDAGAAAAAVTVVGGGGVLCTLYWGSRGEKRLDGHTYVSIVSHAFPFSPLIPSDTVCGYRKASLTSRPSEARVGAAEWRKLPSVSLSVPKSQPEIPLRTLCA